MTWKIITGDCIDVIMFPCDESARITWADWYQQHNLWPVPGLGVALGREAPKPAQIKEVK